MKQTKWTNLDCLRSYEKLSWLIHGRFVHCIPLSTWSMISPERIEEVYHIQFSKSLPLTESEKVLEEIKNTPSIKRFDILWDYLVKLHFEGTSEEIEEFLELLNKEVTDRGVLRTALVVLKSFNFKLTPAHTKLKEKLRKGSMSGKI